MSIFEWRKVDDKSSFRVSAYRHGTVPDKVSATINLTVETRLSSTTRTVAAALGKLLRKLEEETG